MSRPLAVIVLAAGQGKRTKVSIPKVLLPICGRTLLTSVLDSTAELEPERTVVVLGHQKERVERVLAGREKLEIVDQGEPLGTGHAAKAGMAPLRGFSGDVLVVYGDCPLMTSATLRGLREARGDGPCSVLTAVPEDPTGLGRILRDDSGRFLGVREERDCSSEEAEIEEINAGFYCFDGQRLQPALEQLSNDNAQGEYYLTDVPGAFLAAGDEVATVEIVDAEEIQGVNSLTDLAVARELMQERILLSHLDAGVLITDPATTYIDHDVQIGAGTRVLPCTVISSGVAIGNDCEVGPFTHLRPGTVLEDGAELGNFVETKNTTLGCGSKAKHLTYLGDAKVGAKANIGAGTITANYDGVHKHPTVIGDRAFVGSGTVLVAPSTMGEGSMTGAGAIVKSGTEIGDGEVFVGVPARFLRNKSSGGKPAKEG